MSTQIKHPVHPGEVPSTPSEASRWQWLTTTLPWASLVARIVGAGVFGYAGISKIGDPAGGVRAVRAYRILPESLVHPVAYGLPAFEIVLAVLLFLGVASRVVGAITAGLLAVFIAAVSSAGIRGLRIDCGCFGGGGQVEQTHYLLEIGRDSLLLLLLLAVVFAKRSRLSIDERLAADPGEKPLPPGMSGSRRRKLEEVRKEQARRRQQLRGWVAISVAVVALAGAAIGGIAANAAPSSTKTAAVVVPPGATGSGGIVVGSAAAPIKLIAYEDPQCPVCKDFEQVNGPTLHAAINAGKVSVEYRVRSFIGVESVRAANALAAAAAEGKFEALREAVFANQPRERTGGFTTNDLLALGRDVGLTSAQYVDAVKSMKYAGWVAKVDDQASKDGNVGTPELVRVGGKALSIQETLDPQLFKAALGLT
ncbi:MAG TPA: MauE/DoxX family redox-associated membrane protein [Acidothermaceae bacterium]|nr:MauE/DoxX family redox-associated membrane protein [Acidothermaceae bacterium]